MPPPSSPPPPPRPASQYPGGQYSQAHRPPGGGSSMLGSIGSIGTGRLQSLAQSEHQNMFSLTTKLTLSPLLSWSVYWGEVLQQVTKIRLQHGLFHTPLTSFVSYWDRFLVPPGYQVLLLIIWKGRYRLCCINNLLKDTFRLR